MLLRFNVVVVFSLTLLTSLPALSASVSTCLDYSPFHYDINGNKRWGGNNIETLTRVTKTLGYKLDTSVRAPFVRCVKLLETSKVDILAGLIHTKDRAKKFIMVPYSTKERLAIFHLKSRSEAFKLSEHSSKTLIGMHRAFALPDELKASSLFQRLVPIRTVDTGLDMVMKGRIDGVLAAVATGSQILQEEENYGQIFDYQLLPYYGDQFVYFAISKSSPLATRLKDLDQVLLSMSKDKAFSHLQLIPPKAH